MQLAKDSKYKIIQDEDNRQNELMYNCKGNKKNNKKKTVMENRYIASGT